MHFSARSLTAVQRTATAFRLLTVALAALAVPTSSLPTHPALSILGAGYVLFTALLWLLAPYLAWSWLIYPIALVDVVAVTVLAALVPTSPVPLWVLYLLPLASCAAVGNLPVAFGAGLSVAGYLGLVVVPTGSAPTAALWPLAVLIVATLLMLSLASPWVAERRRTRGWQEVAASLRALSRGQDANSAAETVTETARRLVKADAAWLWWHEASGRLRLAQKAGRSSIDVPPTASLAPALASKLRRGAVPLSSLVGGFSGVSGDVIALRQKGEILAILAVAWGTAPEHPGEARERLRILEPSVSETLARAMEEARSREGLRREEVLRHAATEMAWTLERSEVQEILLGAARTGLRAAVSLVERTTGRVLDGDVQVTEALVRLTIDVESLGSEPRPEDTPQEQHEAPLSVMVEDRLALIAWRDSPPLNEAEAAWLSHLAAAGRGALERCGVYERLVAAEQRLRASLETLGAPVALWSPSRTLVVANSAFRELSLMVTTPPPDLLPAETHEQEMVIGDPPRTFVAVSTRTGEGEHVVTVYREVTREREALRAKDDLIAMAGHELRTPLTSIAGYSQLMARQLGVIQQQVGQLNHLIGDFVDASRRDDAQLSLDFRPVDMAELVRRAADRFQGSHPQHSLRLVLAEVPATEGDPARLGQVLDNLLGNAAKYSPPGQEIVLSLGLDDGQLSLSIADSGIGIAPEHLPLLFERFYRVPGVREGFKGLGLGLSIVRDLVAAHGGRVWAESAGTGQGSTFWVTLPVTTGEGIRRLKIVGDNRTGIPSNRRPHESGDPELRGDAWMPAEADVTKNGPS
jgi:signal transduction histidine kinase